MFGKTIAVVPLLALADASALGLTPRDGSCGIFGCLLGYFGAQSTAASSASLYCTNYLSILPKTVIATITATPPLLTITSTSITTVSVGGTITTSPTTTITTTPTTKITATSYCTPSPVTNNNYKRNFWWPSWPQATSPPQPWGQPWGQPGGQPATSTSCSSFTCATPAPWGSTCGSSGLLQSPCLLTNTGDTSLSGCRDSCIGNSQCQSFSFFNSWGPCQLFSKPLSQMGLGYSQQWPNSPLMHYDKGCFSCSPAATTTTAQTTASPVFSLPTQYYPFISSACSCLGVTTPVTTVTSTTTAGGASTTLVVPVTATVHPIVGTVTNQVTVTAAAPLATQTVATLTIPSTLNGTYTNSYGDLYDDFPGTDFIGGDLFSGSCFEGGPGFNVSGTLVPCNDYYGCQDVCSYVNRHGYTCTGITFTPNPSGFMPTQYSTCYLKSQVPGQGDSGCGDSGESNERDSAILIHKGS